MAAIPEETMKAINIDAAKMVLSLAERCEEHPDRADAADIAATFREMVGHIMRRRAQAECHTIAATISGNHMVYMAAQKKRIDECRNVEAMVLTDGDQNYFFRVRLVWYQDPDDGTSRWAVDFYSRHDKEMGTHTRDYPTVTDAMWWFKDLRDETRRMVEHINGR